MNPGIPVTVVWALGVQLGIAFLVWIFFAILARGRLRLEVRLWSRAWLAEVLAMVASLALVRTVGPGFALTPVARLLIFVFVAAKTSYAVLLSRGARAYVRHGLRTRLPGRWLVPVVAGWSLTVALVVPNARVALLLQWLVVALSLIRGGWICRRLAEPERAPWLGAVLIGVGSLYASYLPPLVPVLWNAPPLFDLAAISSLADAAADLLLALAFLVAVEQAASAHLRSLNRALLASRSHLRQLVDRDPLTHLRNRRGVRRTLDHLGGVGGTIIFLDIDDFKAINDNHGHAVGDACLRSVASTLSQTFRPEDTLFRWGGDEFLVIAPALGESAARDRVEQVRARLANPGRDAPEGLPGFTVSVGIASLDVGGAARAALREADDRMYRDKRNRAAP